MILTLLLMVLFSFNLFAGVADPAVVWNKSSVSVCWQNEIELNKDFFTESQWSKIGTASPYLVNLSSEWKEKIQKEINREFKIERVGINFVGWNSCSENPDADAVVIIVNSSKHTLGRASVGRSEILPGEGRRSILPQGKKAFVFLNMVEFSGSRLSYDQEITYSAIHEFGHLAGLNHENTHPEAVSDPNCTDYDLYRENGQDAFEFLTEYDPSSIMNYCFYNFMSKTSLHFIADLEGDIFNDINEVVFPYANFKVYDDLLIFQMTPKTEKSVDVRIKLGLSSLDIKALKLLYK